MRLRLRPEYQRKLREISNCGTERQGRHEAGSGSGRWAAWQGSTWPRMAALLLGSRWAERPAEECSHEPALFGWCKPAEAGHHPPWCLQGSGWTRRWKCPPAPAGEAGGWEGSGEDAAAAWARHALQVAPQPAAEAACCGRCAAKAAWLGRTAAGHAAASPCCRCTHSSPAAGCDSPHLAHPDLVVLGGPSVEVSIPARLACNR